MPHLRETPLRAALVGDPGFASASRTRFVATGPIPFSRYMELCLYEPELGYYSRAREQFGKAGDFYTSSDVHAVFGRLLARQFEEMWRTLDSPARIDLIELGPGRGLFARDVLDWSGEALSRLLARSALRAGGAIGAPARTIAGAFVRAHFGGAGASLRVHRSGCFAGGREPRRFRQRVLRCVAGRGRGSSRHGARGNRPVTDSWKHSYRLLQPRASSWIATAFIRKRESAWRRL